MEKDRKIKNYSIVLIAIVVISFIPQVNSLDASEQITAISIKQDKNQAWLGASIHVEIEFENDINISWIKIHHCAIEPQYICRIPTPLMVRTATNIWEGEFEVVDEEGLIGYYLYIKLKDDTPIFLPDRIDFLNKSNIREVAAGFYYFTIPLTDIPPKTTETTQNTSLGFIVIPFAFLIGTTIWIIRKRKK